jgi:hypothetical protein
MADTPHTFNGEGARRIVNATRRVEGMPQTMPPTYRRRNKAVPRGNGAAPDPTGPTAQGFKYVCKDTYIVSDGSEQVLIGFENVNMVGREFDLAMFDVADPQPWSPREWHPVDCCEDAFEVVATLDLGDGLRADIGVDGADGGQLKIVGVGGDKEVEVKVVGQISCKACPPICSEMELATSYNIALTVDYQYWGSSGNFVGSPDEDSTVTIESLILQGPWSTGGNNCSYTIMEDDVPDVQEEPIDGSRVTGTTTASFAFLIMDISETCGNGFRVVLDVNGIIGPDAMKSVGDSPIGQYAGTGWAEADEGMSGAGTSFRARIRNVVVSE